jgi:hypothetical protein
MPRSIITLWTAPAVCCWLSGSTTWDDSYGSDRPTTSQNFVEVITAQARPSPPRWVAAMRFADVAWKPLHSHGLLPLAAALIGTIAIGTIADIADRGRTALAEIAHHRDHWTRTARSIGSDDGATCRGKSTRNSSST